MYYVCIWCLKYVKEPVQMRTNLLHHPLFIFLSRENNSTADVNTVSVDRRDDESPGAPAESPVSQPG